jgi:hypothetical protein
MVDPGERITEQHRIAQARIAAEAAAAAQERWRQVSPTNMEGTATVWLADSVAAQRTYRQRSRRLTADYIRLLRAFRTGETLPSPDGHVEGDTVTLGSLSSTFALSSREPRAHGDDAVRVTVDAGFQWPQPDEEAEDRRALVSLITTGPVRAQRGIADLGGATRGRLDDPDFMAELDAVMRNAGVTAAGAAERDALMGGRDLQDATSRADRAVIGWARVTDDDPCHFCALLASRGAVYRSFWSARYVGKASRRKAAPAAPPDGWQDWSPERMAQWETRQGLNRFHDNCHCTLVPIYDRTDWVPAASQGFRELYYESTRGLSGDQARAAFRQAIEARRRRAHARGVSVG